VRDCEVDLTVAYLNLALQQNGVAGETTPLDSKELSTNPACGKFVGALNDRFPNDAQRGSVYDNRTPWDTPAERQRRFVPTAPDPVRSEYGCGSKRYSRHDAGRERKIDLTFTSLSSNTLGHAAGAKSSQPSQLTLFAPPL
jgi:hypothetical protein